MLLTASIDATIKPARRSAAMANQGVCENERVDPV
jgi:hypothetical protein